MASFGVELALHEVIFTIDGRQAFPWLHENQAVHAIGNVHPYRCRGAVIDIQPGVERGEREPRAVTRSGKRGGRAAPRTSDSMQIDIVWQFAIGMIVQVKLYHIPMFDADKFPRNAAAKSPEDIVHTISQPLDYFPHFQLDDGFGGMVACEGWGNKSRICQHRDLLSRDLSTRGWRPTRFMALCRGGGFPEHKPYKQEQRKT